MLLEQAGLIDVRTIAYGNKEADRFPKSLTWEGHEFLDASRSQSTWEKAKALVLSKSGTLSFELLKEALVAISKKQLGVGM